MLKLLQLMVVPVGRASRVAFLAGFGVMWIVIPLVGQLYFLLARSVFGASGLGLYQQFVPISLAVTGWGLFCLFANRLHDLGRSGLWALLPAFLPALVVGAFGGFGESAFGWGAVLTMYFGPIVYFGFAIVLLCFKGGEAPNRFGERPTLA